jgi:dipicolinate synthase subunit B
LNKKHCYFVPYKQDDPTEKPFSMVADFAMIPQAIEDALLDRQIQPVII